MEKVGRCPSSWLCPACWVNHPDFNCPRSAEQTALTRALMHLERGREPADEQCCADQAFAPEEQAQASGEQRDVTDTEVASDQERPAEEPTADPPTDTAEPPTVFPELIPPQQPQQKKRPAPKQKDDLASTFGLEEDASKAPQGLSRESKSNKASNIQNLKTQEPGPHVRG